MEQSPSWEANRFKLVKKFPAFYGTRKFITAFTNARHLSLTWARSIQSLPPSHFLKIHLTIIFPSTPGTFKWTLSLRFLHQSPVYTSHLPHTCYMTRPSHSFLFDYPYNIWGGLQIIKLLIMYFSPLLYYLVPLGPNILHNTVFSNTLSPNSSLSMSDQFWHPYKTRRQNYISVYLNFYIFG